MLVFAVVTDDKKKKIWRYLKNIFDTNRNLDIDLRLFALKYWLPNLTKQFSFVVQYHYKVEKPHWMLTADYFISQTYTNTKKQLELM